jgi:cytochrome b6-f complex iron-sulfur subunit
MPHDEANAADKAENKTESTRREFCAIACRGASAAALGGTLLTFLQACGGGGGDGVSQPSNTSLLAMLTASVSGNTASVNVGAGTALANAGSAALVNAGATPLLVSRTGATTFVALTAICTHERCTITGISGSTYVCPCHGSQYSTAGTRLAGPAPSNLRQFPASLTGDTLSITL